MNNVAMNNSVSSDSIANQLAVLHDEYIYRINMVLEADRTDLARELSDEFRFDAARLVESAS